MSLLADLLLAVGALGAGCYCLILSRRLSRFTDLENGIGGAIAVLSVQVDELTKVLATAQESSSAATEELAEMTDKAEAASARLETLLSSIQPEETSTPTRAARVVRRSRRSEAEPVKEAV